jgi:sulfite reductase beta subunit-like hemoprotein
MDAMYRNFVQLAACGLSLIALLSLITAAPQRSAQGLETPEAPQGAQSIRRIIVELSAPPLSVVHSRVAAAPALQRELALRVGQIRIALEQALFIAQVTDARIGAVVTGRAQMTVNSVSLAVSAEKIPLISALRGVKAVHPDPTVERGRP